jgi:hypothetical protein
MDTKSEGEGVSIIPSKNGVSMPAKLAKAFVAAQKHFTNAVADKINPLYNSVYADLESVVNAIRSSLGDNDLGFTHIIHPMDGYAAAETVIVHESGETFSGGIVRVPVKNSDSEGFGSALTFARRYGVSAAFGVATADDDAVKAQQGLLEAEKKSQSGSLDQTSSRTTDQSNATGGQGRAVASASPPAAGVPSDVTTLANAAAIRAKLLSMRRNENEMLKHLGCNIDGATLEMLSPMQAEKAAKDLNIILPDSSDVSVSRPVKPAVMAQSKHSI